MAPLEWQKLHLALRCDGNLIEQNSIVNDNNVFFLRNWLHTITLNSFN